MVDTDANATKQAYLQLLDQTLRTDLKAKAASMLEKAIGVKTPDRETGKKGPECSLTKSIKYNERCITSLHEMGDNLLSVFVGVAESWKKRTSRKNYLVGDFSAMTGNMMNLMTEAVTISRRVSETAQGLHVAVDYLRSPQDLRLLNFSRSGRISIPHYSYNEASSMCLTWLHRSAEKLLNSQQDSSCMNVCEDLLKTTSSFKDALMDLKDSSQLATQIFRVLMYCNQEGKIMLNEYIKGLTAHEVNDIITELQMLRRQLDEITILLEKLGWGLADLWNRCTGSQLKFENLLQETHERLKPVGFGNNNNKSNKIPEGVKNLKSKIKAGRESLLDKSGKPLYQKVPLKQRSKKKSSKDKEVVNEEKFMKKLHEMFGTRYFKQPGELKRKTSSKERTPISGACVVNEKCRFLDESSEYNPNLPEPLSLSNLDDCDASSSRGIGEGDGGKVGSCRTNYSVKSKGSMSTRLSSELGTGADAPYLDGVGPSSTEQYSARSHHFRQQLEGVSQLMMDPRAQGVRASFKKFVREHANEMPSNNDAQTRGS